MLHLENKNKDDKRRRIQLVGMKTEILKDCQLSLVWKSPLFIAYCEFSNIFIVPFFTSHDLKTGIFCIYLVKEKELYVVLH